MVCWLTTALEGVPGPPLPTLRRLAECCSEAGVLGDDEVDAAPLCIKPIESRRDVPPLGVALGGWAAMMNTWCVGR